MNRIKNALFMAAAAALAATPNEYFAIKRPQNFEPINKDKNKYPRWKIGDSFVFAKDVRDAEKYAKKRGLWKEGYKPEIINE